jgi:hypothetical protein
MTDTCFEYHPRWTEIIPLIASGQFDEAARVLEDKERSLENFLYTKVCKATGGGGGGGTIAGTSFTFSDSAPSSGGSWSADPVAPGANAHTSYLDYGGNGNSVGSVLGSVMVDVPGATTGSILLRIKGQSGDYALSGANAVAAVVPGEEFYSLVTLLVRDGVTISTDAMLRLEVYNNTDADLYFYDQTAGSIPHLWSDDPASISATWVG